MRGIFVLETWHQSLVVSYVEGSTGQRGHMTGGTVYYDWDHACCRNSTSSK